MSTRGRSTSPHPLENHKPHDGDVDMDSADNANAKVVTVTNLTRNVVESHLRAIFSFYGEIVKLDLPTFTKCMLHDLEPIYLIDNLCTSPLAHPIVDPRTSPVCLITKDPQREYKDLLEANNIRFISRVVGVSKLKGKFKPFEARRLLLKENDLFLADQFIFFHWFIEFAFNISSLTWLWRIGVKRPVLKEKSDQPVARRYCLVRRRLRRLHPLTCQQ